MSEEKKGKGYVDMVRDVIIEPISKGTSVLNKDRSGIDYSQNPVSGTVYVSTNQMLLQQIRADNKFKSPSFVSMKHADENGLRVNKNESGACVSYFNTEGIRYTKDMSDASGTHKAGEKVLDASGEVVKGYSYSMVWNREQVSPRSPLIALAKDKPQIVPFENAEKGSYYHAANNSPVEKFTEATSAYLNSCYTGNEYKGISFTKEEVAQISEEFGKNNINLFKAITTASLGATRPPQDNVQSNTQENTQERTNTDSRKAASQGR